MFENFINIIAELDVAHIVEHQVQLGEVQSIIEKSIMLCTSNNPYNKFNDESLTRDYYIDCFWTAFSRIEKI